MAANIVFTSSPSLPSPGLSPGIAPLSGTSLPIGSIIQSYDELSNLLPMFITDGNGGLLSFPTVHFKESLSKDLAIHKYPNLDGARVENMGNNPEVWQIKAVFTNNIDPDPTRGETWQRGTLFPLVFLQVLQMLRTPGNKVIQHPLYGNQTVQVVNYDFEIISTGPRDGAYLIINLIKTIAPTNVATGTVNISVITAATSVQTALQTNGPDFPAPPGLSLSQFFGKLGSSIQNVLQFPANVVSGVQDETLSVFAFSNVLSNLNTNISFQTNAVINPISIGASLGGGLTIGNASFSAGAGVSYTTANNTTASTAYATAIQQSNLAANKQAPLGSPSNPRSNNNGTIQATSTSSVQPVFSSSHAAHKSIKSLTTLNTNKSKDASTFIDKSITATQDLMQYYISMNRNEVSNTIFALGQLIYSLQQAQNKLASNTQLTNVVVRTYIPSSNMSWPQLSKLLNNQLSDLFSLNTIGNSNYLFSPAYTPITYYQQNS